jgi:uncharacterized protein YndB with AHSA1/START domain
MSAITDPTFDPARDLVLEAVIDAPPERVWAALTQPELLKQWFCPVPWRLVECEVELRPGGLFRTVMRGPDGDESSGTGCILVATLNERLVWTDAMGPGFRPSTEAFMTADIRLEPEGTRTRYTAIARHASEDTCKQHEEMGFHEGWGKAVEQMGELLADEGGQ